MSTFNPEEKNLILIQALDYFTAGLAGVFVTVYFYSNTDIKTTVFFNIIFYITLLIFYVASGWTLKKVSSGFLIKLGIVAYAIFYLILFFLKEGIANYIIPLAILSGFGAANYWAGLNLNTYIFTNKEKRIEYFGSINSVANIISAVAPLLGGAIIFLTKSYNLLFFIVFLLCALMVLAIGKLPSHEIPNFSYGHITSHKRSRNWRIVLWQQAFWGLYDSVLVTITGILFFLVVKSEFALGTTQTIAYFLGALGSMISIKMLNKNNNYYWLGALGLAAGIGFFAISTNWYGVLFYIIVAGFCAPFLNNLLSTVSLKTIDSVEASWTEKYHFLIERDIALGGARILSYIFLFLFLQRGDQVILARTWLYFLPIFPLALGFLLWKMKTEDKSSPVLPKT